MSKASTVTPRSAFGQRLFDSLNELPGSRRMTAEQLEVVYALAYEFVAQKQYSQALRFFAFLCLYGPTQRHYLSGLALCLQMCKRYDEAVRIYALIGTLFPEASDAALGVAECQIALGQLAQARENLELVAACTHEGGTHAEAHARAKALLQLTAGLPKDTE